MSNPLQALNQSKSKSSVVTAITFISVYLLLVRPGPFPLLLCLTPLARKLGPPLALKLLLLVTQTPGAVPDEKSSSQLGDLL